MPRPKKLKVDKTKKKNITPSDLTCGICGNLKKSNEFYQSNNPLHKTNRVPYCKSCLKEMCFDENNKLDVDKIRKMLQMVDRPFLYDVLQTSISNDADTIGSYFRIISSLGQYKDLTYRDSIMEPQLELDLTGGIDFNKSKTDFNVTDELIDFFGTGYTSEEYKAMDKKYSFLKNNYPEKTNMHIEALKSYVRYKVKEEMCIALDKVGDAAKWAELANKAATNAKINPSQLSKADLSDGLSTFSELSQAVEKEVDIIRILPRFKCRPNDALDFNIWCYVNYIRDLQGLPSCDYEDIYAFYDKKILDYIEQYGDPYEIFKNDTSKKNRENVKRFIKEEGD